MGRLGNVNYHDNHWKNKVCHSYVISINSSQKGRARKISHPVIHDSYKIPGKSTANQIKKKNLNLSEGQAEAQCFFEP